MIRKEVYLKTVWPVCFLSSIFFPALGEVGLKVGALIPFVYGWIGTMIVNFQVFTDEEKQYLDQNYSFWRSERYKFQKYESDDVYFNELQDRARKMTKYTFKSFLYMGACWTLCGISLVVFGIIKHVI